MSRNDLLAVVAGLVALVAAAVIPTAIVSANSTERLRSCVQSGGSYVHVSDTTTMECKR